MIRSKREKQQRMARIIEVLKGYYPDAECALKYGSDPWRLLVMARLSAQCTDARVNEVSVELFEAFPDVRAMANAEISDIERILDNVIFINDGEVVLTAEADELRNREDASIDEIFRRMFKC